MNTALIANLGNMVNALVAAVGNDLCHRLSSRGRDRWFVDVDGVDG